jgi:predicted RNA-binding protein with PUA-like domain
MPRRYWLMKCEPAAYTIDDLARDGSTAWEGVRNYQARNFMRDGMKKGDKVFFYHSSCPEPGIVGIASVAREAHPDPTAFDPNGPYYDPKSDPSSPIWIGVDVKFVRQFKRVISLEELKQEPRLDGFTLLRRGNRLSVMPVSEEHWNVVLGLE